MTSHGWVSLLAGGAHLALAFLVLLRRTRSPIAWPLILLCLDLFAWNLCALAFELSHRPIFDVLDTSLSPLTAALGLHVIMAFVGKLRTMRVVSVATYVVFACIALLPRFGIGPGVPFVVMLIPTAIFAFALLFIHLRRTTEPSERSRTGLMIAAFTIGVTLGPTEYFASTVRVPLGNLGMLICTILVALVTIRFRLLGRELSPSVAIYALFLAAVSVVGCVAIFRSVGASLAVMIAGTAMVTVTLFAATREVASAYGAHRARLTQLATMGRFSSQMAHDLKNPLSTLKGSLQYLSGERAEKKSLDDYGEFIDIMLAQVDRLTRVIDEYQRIGRVEPIRRAVSLNDVVRDVLALQPFAADGVLIETALSPGLPTCEVDVDLLSVALENLVRNALEAMPRGGKVDVSTERLGGASATGVVISVSDTGEGMDPRQVERAFDDFFTTKATGSGLGLAFVKRVVHAHGGEVSLQSDLGRGTVVRMHLPLREATLDRPG